ncbi:Histone methylation protein DOT1 [Seminavis robusta]|uniref:Histone-lysine N-methyltransferase, H3 lysine-79 specific n=1 Tax=Seminavis robusta TaxID=568900 RepID=A0A9N8HBQ6_9STRA|nr:Histone methylation protein DOT1 [Seminavis robusta]|eukprot:Sro348_g123230.1 Histone methylation protein DOT1 (572) ;mRNA; r:37259-39167
MKLRSGTTKGDSRRRSTRNKGEKGAIERKRQATFQTAKRPAKRAPKRTAKRKRRPDYNPTSAGSEQTKGKARGKGGCVNYKWYGPTKAEDLLLCSESRDLSTLPKNTTLDIEWSSPSMGSEQKEGKAHRRGGYVDYEWSAPTEEKELACTDAHYLSTLPKDIIWSITSKPKVVTTTTVATSISHPEVPGVIYKFRVDTDVGTCERIWKDPRMEKELKQFSESCQGTSKDPYTSEQFMELFEQVAKEGGELGNSLEDIEFSDGFRTWRVAKSDSTKQNAAVYGRIMPKATEEIIRVMDITVSDKVLDLGHGLGNLCFQVSFTTGCEARGVELLEPRYVVSAAIHRKLAKVANDKKKSNPTEWDRRAGPVELKHGRIEDPALTTWLTGCTRIFVNNFNEVMDSRSDPTRGNDPVDTRIAALFANCRAGTVMVTLCSIRYLGLPHSQVLERRQRFGLKTPEESYASFFEVEEVEIGPQDECVSWGANSNPLIAYKYTRLQQAGGGKVPGPVFLCDNPVCALAREATPIPATVVRAGGELFMNSTCECGCSQRQTRDNGSKKQGSKKCKGPAWTA